MTFLKAAGFIFLGGSLMLAGVWVAIHFLGYALRHAVDAAKEAHEERRQATDRLVGAWKDGYAVPAPDAERAEVAEPPLPPVVLEYLSQYDERGQEVFGAKARELLRQKNDPVWVVLQLDKPLMDEAEA